MRIALPLLLALVTTGCASQPRHLEHGRPAPHRGRSFGGSRRLLFISPVGEPFRAGPGVSDPQRAWFDGADADRDGRVTRAEFAADAMRFFAMLDRGHDGEIDPADIDYYENTLAPEIRTGGGRPSGSGARGGEGHRGGGMRGGGGGMGSGGMGGGRRHGSDGGGSDAGQRSESANTGRQGAARFGYFDYPEPITVMDRNFNRGIDRDEMATAAADRFRVLDRNSDGVLERGELPRTPAAAAGMGPEGGHRSPPPARREDEAEPDTG